MNNQDINQTWLGCQIVDPSLKYDYHGNKYSLFIGGLKHDTCEDDIVMKIENVGVSDIIDVKLYGDRYLNKYAEVNLFSIKSVEIIKEYYPDKENVFPYDKSSELFRIFITLG